MEALEQLFKYSQSLRSSSIRDDIVREIYQTSRTLCNESITYFKK